LRKENIFLSGDSRLRENLSHQGNVGNTLTCHREGEYNFPRAEKKILNFFLLRPIQRETVKKKGRGLVFTRREGVLTLPGQRRKKELVRRGGWEEEARVQGRKHYLSPKGKSTLKERVS